MSSRTDVWLCLSGGNALGAYHGGVLQALSEHGVQPSRIAGASIGGLTGAIIAGNTAEQRMSRLLEFWQSAADDGFFLPGSSQKGSSTLRALMTGRPTLYRPQLSGLWSMLPFAPSHSSLFDTKPQRDTLERLVDFELIGKVGISLAVTAVDQETGQDITFDSCSLALSVDHIMASTALPVFFPPVVIDGRKLVDPGVSANLPLRALFCEEPPRPVTCICIDLLSTKGKASHSLDTALGRGTDLLFAKQSEHSLAAVKGRFAHKPGAEIDIIVLSYENADEIGMKTFEYSSRSVQTRWARGYQDGRRLAETLDHLPPRRDRLDIYRLSAEGLTDWAAEPPLDGAIR
jgi:NTE family protein